MTARSRVVHSDPEILGGTPVFVGTRVPLKNLIDYLEAGDTLDECPPRELADELVGHEVRTVQQEGWSSLENGGSS